MDDRPCGADATVCSFVAQLLPRLCDANPNSGGKAPKSCQLPRPHPAAIFLTVESREVAHFRETKMPCGQLKTKMPFGQLTGMAFRVCPR
jgi:hypothetical protein